jgi:hypothetical protein
MGGVFQKNLRACGWRTIDRNKLRASPADFWVFVLLGFERRTIDFLIVSPRDFWQRLRSIHRTEKIIQSYLWVTEDDQCWEARGLRREDQLRIASGEFREPHRGLTKWLNNWKPVAELNK